MTAVKGSLAGGAVLFAPLVEIDEAAAKDRGRGEKDKKYHRRDRHTIGIFSVQSLSSHNVILAVPPHLSFTLLSVVPQASPQASPSASYLAITSSGA